MAIFIGFSLISRPEVSLDVRVQVIGVRDDGKGSAFANFSRAWVIQMELSIFDAIQLVFYRNAYSIFTGVSS